MVQAGLKAIYLSGWQVAADANGAGQTYPDQSLYPADSAPQLAQRINNALLRADQIYHMNNQNGVYWFAPIVADAESGFGGSLNAFELMKAMIRSRCGRPSILKISSPRPKNVATWAAKSWFPPVNLSKSSWRPAWRPM
jgi:isocitrate lyase